MVMLQTVNFRNDRIEVISVNDILFISVKKVCKNLGIKGLNDQIKKLKANPAFEAKYIEIQTAGGMQEVFCIPLEKLNGWLFTINPNRVRADIKEKLIAYQNECFKVLYNHFNKKQNYISREFEVKLLEKESLIQQLRDENYQLKNKKANLVRALNTLTKEQDQEKISQKEALLTNNSLEILYQTGELYNELKSIKEKIDERLNRIEIFGHNISRLLPKNKIKGK
jgi:prophage antirepressor-like protein